MSAPILSKSCNVWVGHSVNTGKLGKALSLSGQQAAVTTQPLPYSSSVEQAGKAGELSAEWVGHSPFSRDSANAMFQAYK